MTHREPRIPSQLGRMVGRSPTDADTVRDMAAECWREGRGVMFFRRDLEAMPTMVRAVVEGEARRIYGARRGRG